MQNYTASVFRDPTVSTSATDTRMAGDSHEGRAKAGRPQDGASAPPRDRGRTPVRIGHVVGRAMKSLDARPAGRRGEQIQRAVAT
jgi:hypothetical protein